MLAGGLSSRMGRPKALLPVGSTTLIEYVVERLSPGFGECLVAVRDPEQIPPGLRDRAVRDLHLDQGPLAGIEAGLAAARYDAMFALACDTPNLGLELARLLVEASEGHDAAVARTPDGRIHATAAAYRRSAAPGLAAALGASRNRLSEALEELDVSWLDGADPAQLWNLNTPADYRAFLDAMRKSR